MKGINGEDIVILEDVTPVNSYQNTIKKAEQNKIFEKPVDEEFKRVVYVSMLHQYPPIKVFDMEEYQTTHGLYGFRPKQDGLELEYIDNGYNEVLITSLNYIIEVIKTTYFRISEDLFSLFGVDSEDSSVRRTYGVNESMKTFLFLLRDALTYYSSFDGRILTTRIEWLKNEGTAAYYNNQNLQGMCQFKFVPNFVQWLRCEEGIDHTRIILPFKTIVSQEALPNYANSSRFAQNATSQTFYSYLNFGNLNYVCEYPFIYSLDPDGRFSEASAVFELKNPSMFIKVLALYIAKYVKRNLEVIQLPGTLVSYNFDTVISDLQDEVDNYRKIGQAIHISNMWNPYSKSK